MTTLVTANLSLLSSAPNGIKKLRQLILTLAVQGRLVPQDQSEQPAAEFLVRIAAHKADAAARSRSRRPLEVPDPIEIAAAPYAPPGWIWTTFGNATVCRDGERIPVSQVDREQRKKLYDYYGASGVIDKIDGYLFDKPLLLIGEDGANLVNRSSPIAFIARGQYWVNNHAHVIDAATEGLLNYLELYINAIDLKPYVTGTAQPKMNQAKLNSIPLALPPEAEQLRIVAKVDELMALCDRLETEQAYAEAAHAKLVDALLASLTQARDAAGFRASWQQLAEHFHTLFTTEASVEALKQTIVHLAVMGKLVAPVSGESSASDFLAEIDVARAEYEATLGLRSRQRVEREVPMATPPYPAPIGWEWRNLGSLLLITGGVTLGRKLAEREVVSLPYLRVANVQRGFVVLDQVKEVEVPADEVEKYELAPGDLLTTEGGDWDKVGRTAIWRGEIAQCLHQNHVFRLRPYTETFSSRWVELYLNSRPARDYFAGSSKQTTNLASINMTQLRACAFPVPPLAEQQQIVAVADDLLERCDQLIASLGLACERHEHLASVLVEQAVA